MDGPGPTIVDGMLYVASGYAQWGGLPGNVLLAFEVGIPDKAVSWCRRWLNSNVASWHF